MTRKVLIFISCLALVGCGSSAEQGPEANLDVPNHQETVEGVNGEQVAKVRKAALKVKGMNGPPCRRRVESALKNVDGVQNVDVSLQKGTARVEAGERISINRLINAVKTAGYSAFRMR